MPTKKQTASQRKAAQAAVDHEEAVVAERERRRAARERRADKVRAIEDAVAAEHRRQEITVFRSSLELEVKEGARSLGNDLRWFFIFFPLLMILLLAFFSILRSEWFAEIAASIKTAFPSLNQTVFCYGKPWREDGKTFPCHSVDWLSILGVVFVIALIWFGRDAGKWFAIQIKRLIRR
jgi:hypothetical protein